MKNLLASAWEGVKNNPAVVLTLLAALFGVLSSFGWELTKEQTGAITALVTVIVGFLIRAQVTPTRKVGAREDDLDNDGLIAGPASDVPTGDPVDVTPRDEVGALDTGVLVALACIVVILCGLVWLFRAF